MSTPENAGPKPKQHYIVLPLAAWGHLRPLLLMTFNLCILHPNLQISLLIDPVVSSRVTQALAEDPQPTSVLKRVRIIEILEVNQTDMVDDLKASGKETMPRYLKSLFKTEGEGVSPGFVPPTMAIFDWFQGGFVKSLKGVCAELGIPLIPTVIYSPMLCCALYRYWVPKEKGGFADKWYEQTEKLIEQGVEKYEAYERTWFHPDDEIINVPGLEPMREWEFFPQNSALLFTPHWDEMFHNSRLDAISDEVKAVLIPTPLELDGPSVDALQAILGKKLFAVGPHFSKDVWEGKKPELKPISSDDAIALDFLDEQLRLKGSRSVVYISFGSLFWPVKRPELVTYLIDSLPDDMPFLMSDAPAMSALTDEMKMSFENRGKVVKFAPQWKVLNHPAVNFFVSHLGSNSMQESILAGMPTIAFPFAGDQSEASQILVKLGFTIELEQVRSGVDGKTRWNGVTINSTEENVKAEMREAFARITGPEGEVMREKVKGVRAMYYRSWKEGKSLAMMEEFGRFAAK